MHVDDVRHFLGLGESPDYIAQRAGIKVGSMARRLYRAQEPGLAQVFERAARKGRPKPPLCACGSGRAATTQYGCHGCLMRMLWANPEYREKRVQQLRTQSRNRDEKGRLR